MLLVQYVPHSNGKSLVSVGASDFITLMTVGIHENNWLLIRVCLPFALDNHTAIAAGKKK
jgi:hypothetical protein